MSLIKLYSREYNRLPDEHPSFKRYPKLLRSQQTRLEGFHKIANGMRHSEGPVNLKRAMNWLLLAEAEGDEELKEYSRFAAGQYWRHEDERQFSMDPQAPYRRYRTLRELRMVEDALKPGSLTRSEFQESEAPDEAPWDLKGNKPVSKHNKRRLGNSYESCRVGEDGVGSEDESWTVVGRPIVKRPPRSSRHDSVTEVDESLLKGDDCASTVLEDSMAVAGLEDAIEMGEEWRNRWDFLRRIGKLFSWSA